MVGHTHQDFLPAPDGRTVQLDMYDKINLSEIKNFTQEIDLFDLPGKCFRKVNLSYLDEHIDNLADWNLFIKPLTGVDCLYLVNDRHTCNPIMRDFGNSQNLRYLSKLRRDNIPAVIVNEQ